MGFWEDFEGYFSDTAPGTSQDFGGGTLAMGEGGNATFNVPGTTETLNINANTDPDYIAQWSPGIKSEWDQAYGAGNYGDGVWSDGNNFDIANDATSSTSFSGTRGATDDLLGSWLSNLDNLLNPRNYDQRAEDIHTFGSQNINESYNNAIANIPYLYRDALAPQLQSGINDLASRNMLNSTVASDLLSQVSRNVGSDALGFQTQLEAARAGDLSDLTSQITSLGGGLPALLSAATQGIGNYSESDSGDWQLLASMFPYLLEYGG